uniref:DNA replication factor Cdt1 n=1 Tax=Gasterosteus aculeatus aculeatus TaxID=481459 RepID=UPI001A98B25F|nr:DNA replication factor Cdt1 [Gasterosteus aculeatus aculeatus]
MSQARVTDFFCQRKKGVAAPLKPSRQRDAAGTRSRSSESRGASLCSSSVRDEFVRVIDEAAELNDGRSTAKDPPSGPRTPKRAPAETQFDLGAAVFSATANHSTAKKRRQEAGPDPAGKAPEKATRTKARKKLVLHQSPQAVARPRPGEEAQQHPGSGHKADDHLLQTNSQKAKGPESQALSRDDIAALKSRLQRIKKNAPAPASPPPSAGHPAPHQTPPLGPETAAAADATALKLTVARVKELAAKAQQRKQDREAETRTADAHDSAEQPAYQRYHTLAQAAPPGLSLPFQYKVLAEMFRSMDTVVAMLHNRCETATFAKIKQGVQDMMHKRFEESHVGQIKAVFPEAYTFRQEKNVPTFNSSTKKGRCQLTVEPVHRVDGTGARPVLSASSLLERRQVFHLNLVSIVKEHHKVFLSSLVPPVSVPEDKLTRWHPRFNVDSVPAVPSSSLPQPPDRDRVSTAQEVLEKARSLITPKMEKALVSLAQKTMDASTESASPQNPAAPKAPAPSSAAAAPVPTALKGVSQSLLDRIRAKEAQKLQAAMTRDPKQEERLLMLSRLPELVRILRNVFVAEKKPSLNMEVACSRTVASYRSALSTGEVEKHIRLLAEVAADWLTIHPIRKDFYLKLNKNTELSVVLQKLSSRLEEEERM